MELIGKKNDATFKMIEKDLLNMLQNNSAIPIDEIKKKMRNLLDYYKSRNILKTYTINENIASNNITFQVLVEDPLGNGWTYTFSSKY